MTTENVKKAEVPDDDFLEKLKSELAQGYQDVLAGRLIPAEEVFKEYSLNPVE